jgi:hypothetical protein
VEQSEGRDGCDVENGADGGNRGGQEQAGVAGKPQEAEEAQKAWSEGARTSDEQAEFGFPMGGFKEQIERLLDAARRKREDA